MTDSRSAPETLQSILEDLITRRSDVNETQTESAVTEYILDFFSKLPEWHVTTQEVSPGRKNIIATTSDKPQLVLVAHQDTITITQKSQLTPRQVGEKLYGRGAVDMKAGLAVMLQCAQDRAWKETAMVFTVDEEYHFTGIEKFVATNNWQPQLILNPEPTDLRMLLQCRGFSELEFEVWGKTAHAGKKNEGVNAIEQAVALCARLEKKIQQYDSSEMKSSLNLAALNGGVLSEHDITVRPNIVPDFARVVLEVRLGNSAVTAEKLEEYTHHLAHTLGVKIDQYTSTHWYGTMEGTADTVQAFRAVLERHQINTTPLDPNQSGFYEVQLMQQSWGCPAIVFGPGPFASSHQEDEYVNLTELQTTYAVLKEYLEEVA